MAAQPAAWATADEPPAQDHQHEQQASHQGRSLGRGPQCQIQRSQETQESTDAEDPETGDKGFHSQQDQAGCQQLDCHGMHLLCRISRINTYYSR